MLDVETLVEMARRHVREGDARIRRQQKIADDLASTGSTLTQDARTLLAQLISANDDSREHLARIEEEQRLGRRDAKGDLLPFS